VANVPAEENARRSDKHFDDRYWIDMVRGLYDHEYAFEMQRHLDDGCDVCRRDRDIWLGLVSTGNADGLYEPPEEIVTRVKELVSKRRAIPCSSSIRNRLFWMYPFQTDNLAVNVLRSQS